MTDFVDIYVTYVRRKMIALEKSGRSQGTVRTGNYTSRQCFTTFFYLRHPYVVLTIFGGTPSWLNRCKDQGIVTFGDTPDIILRHPCVSRHPGWESLRQDVFNFLFDVKLKGTYLHFLRRHLHFMSKLIFKITKSRSHHFLIHFFNH